MTIVTLLRIAKVHKGPLSRDGRQNKLWCYSNLRTFFDSEPADLLVDAEEDAGEVQPERVSEAQQNARLRASKRAMSTPESHAVVPHRKAQTCDVQNAPVPTLSVEGAASNSLPVPAGSSSVSQRTISVQAGCRVVSTSDTGISHCAKMSQRSVGATTGSSLT